MRLKGFVIISLILLAIALTFIYIENNGSLIEKEGKSSSIKEEDLEVNKTYSSFTYEPLSEDVIEVINGVSYRENEHVKLEDLSHVKVIYWGFDNREHEGELIVNKDVAKEIVDIFKELYQAKFSIEKIRLIDEYNAKDNLSMADNNTSAFCFRNVTGENAVLSKHSYGMAIDINPVQNPYVKGDNVLPEKGKNYLDRSDVSKGMIVKDDVVYKAFISRGWKWGGDWKSLKDYQHFEK